METIGFNKEKIQVIIDKLQQQLAENVTTEKITQTIQILLAEVQQPNTFAATRRNVTVTIPATISKVIGQQATPANKHTEEANETESSVNMFLSDNAPQEEKHSRIWEAFGIVPEPPTIAHYQQQDKTVEPVELNKKYTDGFENNLEQALQYEPIQNLAAAIDINDRYLFVNELFHGDEPMYEKSIVTLNNFHSYEQACNWMKQELGLKQDWDNNSFVARQFAQLLHRRFA